jgi:hypothetical protein
MCSMGTPAWIWNAGRQARQAGSGDALRAAVAATVVWRIVKLPPAASMAGADARQQVFQLGRRQLGVAAKG